MINLSLFDSARVHSEITLRAKVDSRMSFQSDDFLSSFNFDIGYINIRIFQV